ncbi:MAG: hypothetical protein ABL993_14275 [Vicinamibacterales bacterium]
MTPTSFSLLALSFVLGVWSEGLARQLPTPDQETHVHDVVGAEPSPRDASGTSWLPDETPTYGFHRQLRGWDLMAHGQAFAQFLFESGEIHRRGHQAGSINWIMGMAARPTAGGRLTLRTMVSLEPWTIRGCGYPALLTTGEICDGDTLHDRQHPHDLFMEVAAAYDRRLTDTLRWQLYGGPAGEPALGPVAFPHRLSAFANPIAPIAHHWLDATHISFGVVTAGVYGRRWKAEGSAFNGREPDDRRAGFDLAPLDSVAGRLSVAQSSRLVMQVSAGRLHEAEGGIGAQPRTSVARATASASYHRPLEAEGVWATTLAYGLNSQETIVPGGVVPQVTHGALLESARVREKDTWFGRVEVVGKSAHDLHVHEYIAQVFTVGKLEAGYVRNLRPWNGLQSGIGATVTTAIVPALLAPRYGGRVAPGFGLFLSVRPSRHQL